MNWSQVPEVSEIFKLINLCLSQNITDTNEVLEGVYSVASKALEKYGKKDMSHPENEVESARLRSSVLNNQAVA